MTNWQPIETAPKDGYILVFGPDQMDIAAWEPHWPNGGAWLRMQTAEYDNDGALVKTPTHWQPLPEPPNET